MKKLIEVTDATFEELVLRSSAHTILIVWARECGHSVQLIERVAPVFLEARDSNCQFATVAVKTLDNSQWENPQIEEWLGKQGYPIERFPSLYLIVKGKIEKMYVAEGCTIEQGMLLGRLVQLGRCVAE